MVQGHTINPKLNQMTNQIDTEKSIKELKKIAEAQELGEQLGEIIGAIIATAIIATFIWAILTFVFALSITWVKVFFGFILFDIVKNGIAKAFKN